MQRCFLGCLEARPRIREGANFRSFLFGVARNVLLMHFRGSRRDRDRLDFTERSAEDLGASPVSLLAKEREAHLLLHALRSIPLEYQIVLELYYWEGLNSREIADMDGTPEATIRTRLRRAKLAFNRGEYSEARADAEAALEVAPELAVARELRARTLLELGEAGAALEATSALLREVLAARVEALLSQAQGLLFQESYQEAKVFCELALWAEPDSVDGYALRATTSRLLGEVAEQSGRPRDAAALYRAAVADHHAYLQRQPGLRAAERAGVEGEVRKLEERLAALGDR